MQRRISRIGAAFLLASTLLVGVVVATAKPSAAALSLLTNGGFETGSASPWNPSSDQGHNPLVKSVVAASGSFSADLCNSNDCYDELSQPFRIPTGVASATLTYKYRFDSTEEHDPDDIDCFDELGIGITDASGAPIENAGLKYCELDQTGGVFHSDSQDVSAALQARQGQGANVLFYGFTDVDHLSRIWVDDVVLSITLLPPTAPTNAQAIPTGAGAATVTWGAPASGSVPTSYTVTPPVGSAKVVAAGVRTASFTGLSQSASGSFTVTATNDGGTGPAATTNAIIASTSANVRSAVSDKQYSLAGSNGSTWTPMDSTNLVTTFTAPSDGKLILDGNSDLWTANAGFNQDLGIQVTASPSQTVPLAWKESGGFAGTFSPNAAAVTTVVPATSGTTYTATLVWKTNKNAPGATIFAGAGPIGQGFSPTRLGLRFVPDSTATPVVTKVTNKQYTLSSNNGTTWVPIDSTPSTGLTTTLAPTADGIATVTVNADLWTANASFNQDIGIKVTPSSGAVPDIMWKESGGFAGTFSPNAALVETRFPVSNGMTYTIEPVWKMNKAGGSNVTIYAGAGNPGAFSPLTVVASVSPANAVATATSGKTNQYSLANNNGSTWTNVDGGSVLTTTFTPTSNGFVTLTGNADLWTENLGYNQDLGISVSPAGTTVAGITAWKESGGFAGAFSPNAAAVQTLYPVTSGTAYTFTLKWKTNIASPANVKIHSGAGNPGDFSPTRLHLTFTPAPLAAG